LLKEKKEISEEAKKIAVASEKYDAHSEELITLRTGLKGKLSKYIPNWEPEDENKKYTLNALTQPYIGASMNEWATQTARTTQQGQKLMSLKGEQITESYEINNSQTATHLKEIMENYRKQTEENIDYDTPPTIDDWLEVTYSGEKSTKDLEKTKNNFNIFLDKMKSDYGKSKEKFEEKVNKSKDSRGYIAWDVVYPGLRDQLQKMCNVGFKYYRTTKKNKNKTQDDVKELIANEIQKYIGFGPEI